MKTKDFNRYSYAELLSTATAPDAQQIDIDTLGAWFERYDPYWNGEFYDADGKPLYPIYSDPDDNENIDIVGYSFERPY